MSGSSTEGIKAVYGALLGVPPRTDGDDDLRTEVRRNG
jgi:hypothetical protein